MKATDPKKPRTRDDDCKDDSRAKREPINILELGGGKRGSAAFKCEILRELKALKYIPEDVAVSERRFFAYRKQAAERRTSYGMLLQQKVFQTEAGPKQYPIQHPLAMLELAMASPRFGAYVRDALEVHAAPSIANPWSVVVYIDEITCGNPMAVRDNAKRKVQGFYWSLYQLGPRALADESCWFELASFRTSETGSFVGGVSQLLDVGLTCFFDPEGFDASNGVLMPLLGSREGFMLVLRIEMLIADIKAIVEAIGANGVSAHLPCWFCRRVLSFRALQNKDYRALLDDGYVDLSCTDKRKWGMHTNASLQALLRELDTAHATLSAEEYGRTCTLRGYKHLPNNFLRNCQDPLAVLMCDWMHPLFQTADWNREAFQVLLEGTSRDTKAYALLMAYVAEFTFPTSERSVESLLSEAHWNSCKAAEVFKCTASDGLTLYALFAKFFENVLLPRFAGARNEATLRLKIVSYNHLCDVIDLLQLSKFGRDVEPDLLDDKVAQWRDSHATAYDKSLTYLKTHLTSHLSDMLRTRRRQNKKALLMACWTLDRAHVSMHVHALYE